MSEINPFVEVNYYEQAKDRVTYAFEDAPVLDKYLQLLTAPQLDLQNIFRDLLQQRSIDTAVGKQLDIIGRIVGQDRILIEAELAPYFGYIGALLPEGYGDLNDGSLGGFYWDINNPLSGNITLNDEQYRLFIKAKILKNITSATPEDVINFIQFVFEVEKVYISYDQGAHATILVSDDINLFERVLLTFFTQGKYKSYFVPKTLGVGYDFGTFTATNFFGFFGTPGANSYGDVNDPSVGGYYATLI